MTLKLIVLAIWGAVHPAAPHLRDAAQIADAIEGAVSTDAEPPVFGSHEEDAAVMAYWALRESWLLKDAVGDGGRSFGAWQQPASWGRTDLPTQARSWLALLHQGARICPQSPAAPLSGGCAAGRGLADRRAKKALRLLEEARQKVATADAAPAVP